MQKNKIKKKKQLTTIQHFLFQMVQTQAQTNCIVDIKHQLVGFITFEKWPLKHLDCHNVRNSKVTLKSH